MNLMGIVQSAITVVNPYVSAQMNVSTGYTTNPDFTRTPSYSVVTGQVQVQALTYRDLLQLDGINLGGEARRIYFYGDMLGIVGAKQKGGDIVTLTDGPNVGNWLIVHVLETWPDWSACACVLQKST